MGFPRCIAIPEGNGGFGSGSFCVATGCTGVAAIIAVCEFFSGTAKTASVPMNGFIFLPSAIAVLVNHTGTATITSAVAVRVNMAQCGNGLCFTYFATHSAGISTCASSCARRLLGNRDGRVVIRML